MLSFIVSCVMFYVIPFLMYKFPLWKTPVSPDRPKLEPLRKERSLTYYAIITGIYITTISVAIFISWKVFRRLPLRVKYEIYAGIDTIRLLFIVIYRKLQTLLIPFKYFGWKSKMGCDSCDSVQCAFNDTCIETEILNFCLSLPKDSEKWALAAAIKVKRKQQAEIDWYNAKLKTLEDAGVNVDLDKLVKTQCQLADPFSAETLDPAMLKKYEISMTNYVPYQHRIERDRPWYPSLVAARRKGFRKKIYETATHLHPSDAGVDTLTVGASTGSSTAKHHRMSFSRRHSESSMAGLSSRSTPLSDIIGLMGQEQQSSEVGSQVSRRHKGPEPSAYYTVFPSQSPIRESSSSFSTAENEGLRNRVRANAAANPELSRIDDVTPVAVGMNMIFTLASENAEYSGLFADRLESGEVIMLEKGFSKGRRSASVDVRPAQEKKRDVDEEAVVARRQSSEVMQGPDGPVCRKNSGESSFCISHKSSAVFKPRKKSLPRTIMKRKKRSNSLYNHPSPGGGVSPNANARRFSLAEVLLLNQEIRQQSRFRNRRGSGEFSFRRTPQREKSPRNAMPTSSYSTNLKDRTGKSVYPKSNLPVSTAGEKSTAEKTKYTSSSAKKRTRSESRPTTLTPDKRSSPVDTDKIMPACELQVEMPASPNLKATPTEGGRSNEYSLLSPGICGQKTNTSEAIDQFSMGWNAYPDDTSLYRGMSGYSSRETSMPDDTSLNLSVPEMIEPKKAKTLRRQKSMSTKQRPTSAVRFQDSEKPKKSSKKTLTSAADASSLEDSNLLKAPQISSTPAILVQTESTQIMQGPGVSRETVSDQEAESFKSITIFNESDLALDTQAEMSEVPHGGSHLTLSPQTTWGQNTLVTLSAAGSYQGDYKVLPDFRESHWDPKSLTGENEGSAVTSAIKEHHPPPRHRNNSEGNSQPEEEKVRGTRKSRREQSKQERPDQQQPSPALVFRIANQEELEPPKFRIIEYDENLQTFRKVDVLND